MHPDPDQLGPLFSSFAVALLVGALVGVERERYRLIHGEVPAGLRSFTLLSLLGALAAFLGGLPGGGFVFPIAFLGVVALLAIGGAAEPHEGPGSTAGLTTRLAGVVVFLLGAAVISGERELAVAIAIVVTTVLALESWLHDVVRRLSTAEAMASLQLLIATFIVLPLLPAEAIDPWDAIRPYGLWWLVILVASMSLVGYVGVRLLGGQRGFLVAGLFGGLVSSTAVSLSLSRQSQDQPDWSRALAGGVLLSWATMVVRVLVEVAVVERSLLPWLLAPGLGFLLPALAAVALLTRRNETAAAPDLGLANPFSLLSAAKVGAAFAVVLLVVRLTQVYLPPSSVHLVAALAGLTDVDAITLSLAGEVRDGRLAHGTATTALLLAGASNTLVKLALVGWFGRGPMRAACAGATLLMFAGAALGVFAASWW